MKVDENSSGRKMYISYVITLEFYSLSDTVCFIPLIRLSVINQLKHSIIPTLETIFEVGPAPERFGNKNVFQRAVSSLEPFHQINSKNG